jgi:signal transduction histidine kinase
MRWSWLHIGADAGSGSIGDNGQVGDNTPGWLGSAMAFARSVEPSEPLPRRAVRTDLMFAGLALVAALIAIAVTYRIHEINVLAALATSAPLAIRRRFPLAAFVVLLAGIIAAKDYVTDLTFLVVVIAGYSAAVHSRFRGLALLTVAAAGAVLADVFWKVQGGIFNPAPGKPPISNRLVYPKLVLPVPQPAYSWRIEGFLVLIALVAIAIVGGSVHAGNRIRRLQAEHVAATRQALETERARIARELHDVVTHNVSVMIVQAGAARQVLAASPADATQALLAVESSGRSAMSELRHLLGLLSPASGSAEPDEGLRPQPGLGQLRTLIDRTAAAGLPVALQAGELPARLTPGADLAAYRVVQEALTNVLRHAGKPVTTVRVGWAADAVVVEVVNEGPPVPAARPASEPGVGRGLAGLRERIGVYGGDVEAGPVPGGGWRVWARIPVNDAGPVSRSDDESAGRGVVTEESRYPAAAAP